MENLSLKNNSWEFTGRTVVRTRCFHGWGWGSIPGQQTKIPQAAQRGRKQLHRRSIRNKSEAKFSYKNSMSKKKNQLKV